MVPYVAVLFCTTASGWIILLCWVARRIHSAEGNKRAHLIKRLRADLFILKSQWVMLAAGFFMIMYVQGIAGRDLAYFRHYPLAHYVDSPSHLRKSRLEDVGFDIVPDMTSSIVPELISNLMQYSFATMITIVCLIPYIQEVRRSNDDPYFAEEWDVMQTKRTAATAQPTRKHMYTMWMATRLILAIATGHAMRMFVFLATSLPGPAIQCINLVTEEANRPKTAKEILLHPHVASNCGDLVFSGHMLFAVSSCLALFHYAPKMLRACASTPRDSEDDARTFLIPHWKELFRLLLALMLLLQIYLLLASRSHYSVDIVVGCMVAYFNWELHLLKWRPNEPRPGPKAPPLSKEDTVELAICTETTNPSKSDANAVVEAETTHSVVLVDGEDNATE